MKQDAKETVLACIKALNEEDYTRARNYMHDGMQFVGVLGTRDGADAYFADMQKMKLHYEILKAVAEGEDVCLLYQLEISGTRILSCGWYHVRGGRIDRLEVLFDPRPILEAQSQQSKK